MTTPAGLSDAECDAIIERTMQTANERDWVDRTLVRAAYAAGQAASVPREWLGSSDKEQEAHACWHCALPARARWFCCTGHKLIMWADKSLRCPICNYAAPAVAQPKCERCDDTGCPECDPEWAQHQVPAQPAAQDKEAPPGEGWPGYEQAVPNRKPAAQDLPVRCPVTRTADMVTCSKHQGHKGEHDFATSPNPDDLLRRLLTIAHYLRLMPEFIYSDNRDHCMMAHKGADAADEAAATIRALREDMKRFTADGLLDVHAICDQRDLFRNNVNSIGEQLNEAQAERDDYKTIHEAIMRVVGHSEVSSRPLYMTVEDVVKQRDAAIAALRKIASCESHHPDDVVAIARRALVKP